MTGLFEKGFVERLTNNVLIGQTIAIQKINQVMKDTSYGKYHSNMILDQDYRSYDLRLENRKIKNIHNISEKKLVDGDNVLIDIQISKTYDLEHLIYNIDERKWELKNSQSE